MTSSASKIISLILFALTFLLHGQISSGTENNTAPSERITFEVKWSFITAGEATLEFFPDESLENERANRYLFKARTNKYVDMIYKVRDSIESYTDISLTHSLLYKKSHRAGSSKDIAVAFDWSDNSARYSMNGNSIDPITVDINTFDPLSVFFAFRKNLPDKDNDLRIKLTDGKRYITAVARMIKKEKIKIAGKVYDTVLVEPEMEGVSGVFKKEKKARLKIWVTDDRHRIPVRIKSKVAVGSFTASLIAYEGNYDAE